MVASGVGKPDGARFSEPFVIEPAHQVAREQANTITALGQPTAAPVPRLPTLVGTVSSASRENGHAGWGLYNINVNVDLLQAWRSSGTPEHTHPRPQSWCHQRNPGDGFLQFPENAELSE